MLGSTDRTIDLVQDGVDCAIRVGSLDDSRIVARPLGRLALINCASPAYLHERGVPKHPSELPDNHLAVGYASTSNGREVGWEYQQDGHELEIPVPSRVIVNNAESYIACSRAGLGLIQVPRFDVQYLLDSGGLVEVMPAHRAAPMDISLLYSHRRQRSRRLAVFVEWFEALLRPHLDQ